MTRIRCLQHVPFESPGRVAAWSAAHGHEFAITRLFAGEPLPALSALDALVLMGGPMSVHDDDEYPWMRGEKHLAAAALEAGLRVLGICLGAQMIALASGVRVYRNRFQEIGWYPLEATDEGVSRFGLPRSFRAFHWHGDTFQLPNGAVNLARTDACEHQMFAVGDRVLGIQFHMEVMPDDVAGMYAHAGTDLPEGPYVQAPGQTPDLLQACAASHLLMDGLLDRWMGEPE